MVLLRNPSRKRQHSTKSHKNLRPELKPSSCVFSPGGLGLNLSEPEVENPTSLLLKAILASTQDVLSPNLPLEG